MIYINMSERVIDKDLEDEIKKMVNKQIMDSKEALMRTGDMMREQQKGFEDSVSNKPYEWLLGAFVSGLILGKLMDRR
jgi:ElaB/YqjD/DUF883 family membrane-anchored ribosome-binding protein